MKEKILILVAIAVALGGVLGWQKFAEMRDAKYQVQKLHDTAVEKITILSDGYSSITKEFDAALGQSDISLTSDQQAALEAARVQVETLEGPLTSVDRIEVVQSLQASLWTIRNELPSPLPEDADPLFKDLEENIGIGSDIKKKLQQYNDTAKPWNSFVADNQSIDLFESVDIEPFALPLFDYQGGDQAHPTITL